MLVACKIWKGFQKCLYESGGCRWNLHEGKSSEEREGDVMYIEIAWENVT